MTPAEHEAALAHVVSLIRSRQIVHLWSESHNRKWHIVQVEGRHGVAIYHPEQRRVVSLMTTDTAIRELRALKQNNLILDLRRVTDTGGVVRRTA